MSERVQEAVRMLNMLPEQEQDFACEMIRKILVAWDPDYVKVTPEESRAMDAAEKSGWTNAKDIDWDNIEKYA